MIKLQTVSEDQLDRLFNLDFGEIIPGYDPLYDDTLTDKLRHTQILLALKWAWHTYHVQGSVYPAGQPIGYKVMDLRGAYPRCVSREKVRDNGSCDPYDLAEQKCLDAVLTYLEQLKKKNKLCKQTEAINC